MKRIVVWLHYPPWLMLVAAALILGSMPMVPEPHLVQKMKMLLAGELVHVVDIFDLFWHGWPALWLLLRLLTLPMVERGESSHEA